MFFANTMRAVNDNEGREQVTVRHRDVMLRPLFSLVVCASKFISSVEDV